MNTIQTKGRRKFLKQTSMASLVAPVGLLNHSPKSLITTDHLQDDNLNIVGPKNGYTPQIGTLVSMLNWMRNTLLYSVRNLSQAQLDYLHDDESNTVGAMLMHLAATERFYQINTFDNKSWGEWPKEDDDRWSVPMSLGQPARESIKGNNVQFYLDAMDEVRSNTLEELKHRDDEWLLSVDQSWGWGPTNNYCKWFHVCEHESNHNGQIKYINSRADV